ncbi:MAG TPA: N-acetylglucosamine-6-phosphate deacetylase [Nevskiaceae bacterium]|uniref:N-acetylglucosamine-6-phosphate deacetylase n=1 Tax=Rhodanobacter glycinis TaxID=582702 RepID=A0A5B9E1J1_9GAMM|nr:N-acetylglucosamine-6-phosphate deacetylase [Rhodanobacter glycinis]QEE26163.1 N-acetylglucosamine-6-phosphate deacetylase [Rhodanobacter glycinis]HEU0195621.1 N-acetylglucosamine-6-phosphate deacetylase [Nevskiaceae bacterium]
MENAATIALVNGRVLGDHGPREGLAVLVEGERIAAIVAQDDPRVASATSHDLGGHLLLPGFIDVQVNGGGGLLFNDAPTVDTLRGIAAAHRTFGTTGLLPTLITDTAEKMHAALDAVDAAIEQRVPGILGIHLEGPFLAPARKGIHDARLFRHPDADDLAMLAAKHRGRIMLTLAPEQVSTEVIRTLSEAGVIVVAGHTAADYATTRAALDAGICGFTHLYNAMTPLASREPGVVGAALDDPHSWCGLIVDGHHVHPASLRVAIAAKARGKCVLVTDAMPPVGSDDPSYTLNGQTIVARDGICQSEAGVLAGSALDMATGVRNLVEMVGLPLTEASRMASTYPAAWLGLGRTHGRLAAGYRADFAVLDDALVARETWIGGVVYPAH